MWPEDKEDAEADKGFLFYRLRASDYRHHILATASGSTVRHTSPGRICEFETTLPLIDEQQQELVSPAAFLVPAGKRHHFVTRRAQPGSYCLGVLVGPFPEPGTTASSSR